jgi:hypothetical protein
MAVFSFSKTQAEEAHRDGDGEFPPIPAGWYPATINAIELKRTQAGTGEFLNFKFEIFGPNYSGRMVFSAINVKNPSAEAERIAHVQLGKIIEAIGIESFEDTDTLLNRQLEIKLAVKAATEKYAAGNDVKDYRGIGKGDVASPATAAKAPATAAPAKAATSAPWERK